MKNVDAKTVEGFGREWTRFDHSGQPTEELQRRFDAYFRIFPWEDLPPDAEGFDAGCGSGRWARLVAPRVARLHAIDASPAALDVARRNLAATSNCELHLASISELPLADRAMDFGYSLGVLHHLPDPEEGLRACVQKLKPGAPFLVYFYYALDGRPSWYRLVWRLSDAGRRAVSRFPWPLRYAVSQVVAAVVYWPLARLAGAAERLGIEPDRIPLAAYRDKRFYVMRTDALDRFGTPLEHRLTRPQLHDMMERCGLDEVRFSDRVPFWCAVGRKSRDVGER